VEQGSLSLYNPFTDNWSEPISSPAIHHQYSLHEQVSLNFEQQRAVAGLTGLLGVVALIRAAVRPCGITAYAVVQRTRELGGHGRRPRRRHRRVVMRGAFENVACGLLPGIPLALCAGCLISSQLYGVEELGPAGALGGRVPA
jgi:hypothetical protein